MASSAHHSRTLRGASSGMAYVLGRSVPARVGAAPREAGTSSASSARADALTEHSRGEDVTMGTPVEVRKTEKPGDGRDIKFEYAVSDHLPINGDHILYRGGSIVHSKEVTEAELAFARGALSRGYVTEQERANFDRAVAERDNKAFEDLIQ